MRKAKTAVVIAIGVSLILATVLPKDGITLEEAASRKFRRQLNKY